MITVHLHRLIIIIVARKDLTRGPFHHLLFPPLVVWITVTLASFLTTSITVTDTLTLAPTQLATFRETEPLNLRMSIPWGCTTV